MAEENDDISEDDLAEIRRAAFELRHRDPQEAVRVLRKVAAGGGGAAVLAHGALGEIYLDEFSDLDAAEAEFRKVLAAAPKLPAAQLGLGRVLRASGRQAEADQSLLVALQGFTQDLARLQQLREQGEPLPEGAEESALAVLEVALELAELRHEIGKNGSVQVPVDEALLLWAQRQKLFDRPLDEEVQLPEGMALSEGAAADLSDWVRFHSLWAALRVHTGRALEAAAVVADAEKAGELPPEEAARLRSEALEEAGDLKGALEEARRLNALEEEAGRIFEPDDISHFAGLLQALGDEPAAQSVLQKALTQAEAQLARPLEPGAPDEEAREALREAVKGYKESLGPAAVVGLGRLRG
jgi:hypothetical protein